MGVYVLNKKLNDILERVKTGTSQVVGLGRSNYPLIDYLLSEGAAHIIARDARLPEPNVLEKYQRLGVEFVCGDGYLDGMDGNDTVIFRTPAVKPFLPELEQAVRGGALLTSEMELFLMLTPSLSFGITGSDGKTTTTTLIYKMLEKKHSTFVGGNIGVPLLPRLSQMTKDSCSVVELSSFQLMGIDVSADIAVITNITPNHLNWHRDMAEYTEAKMNIFTHGARRLVINADDALSVKTVLSLAPSATVTAFSSTKCGLDDIKAVCPVANSAIYLSDGAIVYENVDGSPERLLEASDIKLPGKHNIENYMAAIGATYGYVDKEIYSEIARTFGGVEHRLEFVRELNGVKYYNSSIDSSPTRTAAALSALTGKPIVICGGSDKNIPFEPLAMSLCNKAKAVVLTGEAGPKIKRALLDCTAFDGSDLKMYEVPVFLDAVLKAHELATVGDIVLLSPACASFDAFKNFEERGNTFKKIVGELE